MKVQLTIKDPKKYAWAQCRHSG